MNLSHPISSVIPSRQAAVLSVLARTEHPLSGRQIASLAESRISPAHANTTLRALTESGLVLCEEHPPSKLYVLNRDHVAAEAIVSLSGLRRALLDRIVEHIARWLVPTRRAILFGSLARGTGTVGSDIDVLIVRPNDVGNDDPDWTGQIDDLLERIKAWSGNSCSILEYSESELDRLSAAGEPILASIRAHGVDLLRASVAPPRKRVTSA